jgi:crotonobetainyl-CoA:carnitine CoA-transferase CaiB-like acyl-CoA transferase
MLDSTAAMLTYQAGIYFMTGRTPVRMGNRHPTIAPYETFATADGELVLSVGNDDQWRRFCRAAGLDALGTDERFATNGARVNHYDELGPILVDRLRTRTRAEWIATLDAAGVPCGAVKSVAEVVADEQLRLREMIVEMRHPTVGPMRALGVPVKLSDTPGGVRTPPPVLGQHTDAVLQELGFGEAAIDRLRQDGVI